MDRETAIKTLKAELEFKPVWDLHKAIDFAIAELSKPKQMACYEFYNGYLKPHSISAKCFKYTCSHWNGTECTGGYWREYKQEG